jgi:hypothetical protein
MSQGCMLQCLLASSMDSSSSSRQCRTAQQHCPGSAGKSLGRSTLHRRQQATAQDTLQAQTQLKPRQLLQQQASVPQQRHLTQSCLMLCWCAMGTTQSRVCLTSLEPQTSLVY